MDINSVFGLAGAIMNIIGGFVLVMGFFGKSYQNLCDESSSAWGYNLEAYTSLAEQKSSGIVGFTILLFGFVEQAIPFLPYNTSMTSMDVAWILFAFNGMGLLFLFSFRAYMTRFYVGLLLITWVYHEKPIPNQYVREVVEANSLQPSADRTKFLERRAKRNIKLCLSIAKVSVMHSNDTK